VSDRFQSCRRVCLNGNGRTEEQNPLSVIKHPEEIGGTFCRFSVGLEDADDLIADLERALGAVK